jgi:hypothetical protein
MRTKPLVERGPGIGQKFPGGGRQDPLLAGVCMVFRRNETRSFWKATWSTESGVPDADFSHLQEHFETPGLWRPSLRQIILDKRSEMRSPSRSANPTLGLRKDCPLCARSPWFTQTPLELQLEQCQCGIAQTVRARHSLALQKSWARIAVEHRSPLCPTHSRPLCPLRECTSAMLLS